MSTFDDLDNDDKEQVYEDALESHLNVTKIIDDFNEEMKFSREYDVMVKANLDTPGLIGKYSKIQARLFNRKEELKIEQRKVEATIRDNYRKEIANHRVAVKGEVEDRISLDDTYLDISNKISRLNAKEKIIETLVKYILVERNRNIYYHLEMMKFRDKSDWTN
jgi:hypothetical protein